MRYGMRENQDSGLFGHTDEKNAEQSVLAQLMHEKIKQITSLEGYMLDFLVH